MRFAPDHSQKRPFVEHRKSYLHSAFTHERFPINPDFQKIIDQMEPLLQELLNSSPHTIENGLRNLPRKGVYAFYENGEAIYVGRSNRIRDRIREHGAESSRHESATFAYKLMLEEVGEQGGHSSQLSRHDLQNQYEDKYRGQRKRIREMEVRTVAIEDQRVQAVLEIYAILALGTTKYNSFQTT